MKKFEQEHPIALRSLLTTGGAIEKITRCMGCTDNFFHENTTEDFEKFKKELDQMKRHNRVDFMTLCDSLDKILSIKEAVLNKFFNEVNEPSYSEHSAKPTAQELTQFHINQNAKLTALELSRFINFYNDCPYADNDERVLSSREFYNLTIPLTHLALDYAEREMNVAKELVSSLSSVSGKQTYLDILKTGELIKQHVKTASAYGAYTYTKGISFSASFGDSVGSDIDGFINKLVPTIKDHFLLALPYDKENGTFTILFNTDTEKSEKVSRNRMEQAIESLYDNDNIIINSSVEVDTPMILAEAFNRPIREVAKKVQYKKEASQSVIEM